MKPHPPVDRLTAAHETAAAAAAHADSAKRAYDPARDETRLAYRAAARHHREAVEAAIAAARALASELEHGALRAAQRVEAETTTLFNAADMQAASVQSAWACLAPAVSQRWATTGDATHEEAVAFLANVAAHREADARLRADGYLGPRIAPAHFLMVLHEHLLAQGVDMFALGFYVAQQTAGFDESPKRLRMLVEEWRLRKPSTPGMVKNALDLARQVRAAGEAAVTKQSFDAWQTARQPQRDPASYTGWGVA